jgi:serine/threonine protein kinase
MHRDLKPANLLVSRPLRIKISDFGISRKVGGDEDASATAGVGTQKYMAPDQELSDHGPECDVWSVGIILGDLCFFPEEGDGGLSVWGGGRGPTGREGRVDPPEVARMKWQLWLREGTNSSFQRYREDLTSRKLAQFTEQKKKTLWEVAWYALRWGEEAEGLKELVWDCLQGEPRDRPGFPVLHHRVSSLCGNFPEPELPSEFIEKVADRGRKEEVEKEMERRRERVEDLGKQLEVVRKEAEQEREKMNKLEEEAERERLELVERMRREREELEERIKRAERRVMELEGELKEMVNELHELKSDMVDPKREEGEGEGGWREEDEELKRLRREEEVELRLLREEKEREKRRLEKEWRGWRG